MIVKIEEGRLKGLVRQAYLNGVADAGISKYSTGLIVQGTNFEKSTACYELNQILEKELRNV